MGYSDGCIVIDKGVQFTAQIAEGWGRGGTYTNSNGKTIFVNVHTTDCSYTEDKHGLQFGVFITSEQFDNTYGAYNKINTKHGVYCLRNCQDQTTIDNYAVETSYGGVAWVTFSDGTTKRLEQENHVTAKDFFNPESGFWDYVRTIIPPSSTITNDSMISYYYKYNDIILGCQKSQKTFSATISPGCIAIYPESADIRFSACTFSVYTDDTEDFFISIVASKTPIIYTGRKYYKTIELNSGDTLYLYTGVHDGYEQTYYFSRIWYENLTRSEFTNNNDSVNPENTHCVYLDYNYWGKKADLDNPNSDLCKALDAALNGYESKDYMDLNIAGNSEVSGVSYEFIEPKSRLAYNSAQTIKMDISMEGATSNAGYTKHIAITVPANTSNFVHFTGKVLTNFNSAPVANMLTISVTDPAGNKIAEVTRAAAEREMSIPNIFDFGGCPTPTGGTWKVKIYTPFIFLRQVYNCYKKEELPQKGTPTYEIFQPNTSSTHVNPAGTGTTVQDYIESFATLTDMKKASDGGE